MRYVTLETGTPCASEPTGARKGATLILVSRTDQSRKGIAPNHRCGSTDVKRYWDLVKRVANAWIDDHVPSMGAALAYYTLFSLAPLLLIVTAVAGLVFGREAARGEIQAQLSSLMGERGAGVVQDLLASVDQPAESTAAAMLGVVLLLIGATTVFGELQYALDRIWRAPEHPPSTGWLSLVRERLLSFGMILAIGFLLMVSLVTSAALALVGRWWNPIFGDWYALATLGNHAAGFLLVSAVFALIYKVMLQVTVAWNDVWVGAIFTALLFTLGKWMIGLYVGHSGVTSGFGAAGSLVVVLVWVYYSAQIFLLGAEFTWVYANTFGSRSASHGRPPAPA